MFIRERPTDAAPWHHTRQSGDGFVFGVRAGLHEARLAPNADRAVELFLAITEHFGPFGHLVVDDWRRGRVWRGEDLSTADVREAVARARHVLTAHAGTELTLVADGEQATLTANLGVRVYAPTDRWLFLLQGKGLRRVHALRRRSWALGRGEFGPVAAAEEMVSLLVARLQLAPDTGAVP
ncbi:MAG: hypothetical protein JNJ98_02485 [Gemmatimonadetes bacterium]|nr:hypothetical protein [Gemmatimonadota bacterium]